MKKNTKKILATTSLLSLSLLLSTPCLSVQANDFGNSEDYSGPYSQVVPFSTTILYTYAEQSGLNIFTYDNYKTLADKYSNGYFEYVAPGSSDTIISLSINKGEEDYSSNFYSNLTTASLSVDCFNESSDGLTFEIAEFQFFFTNVFVDKTFFNDMSLFLITFYSEVDFSYELFGRYSYIQNNQPILNGIYLYDNDITSDRFFISLSMFDSLGIEDAIFIYDLSLKITFSAPYHDIYNESANFVIYSYYMPQELIPGFSIFSSLIIGGGFVDLSQFLESSIGGFLSFEIAPGFSIYIILGLVFGISLLFAILKIYFGG